MNIKYDQHIGIYENVMPIEWCNTLANIFKNKPENVSARSLAEKNLNPLLKNDSFYDTDKIDTKLINTFYTILNKEILNHYNNKYTFLQPTPGSRIKLNDFKLQRTLPTEGYHIWHYENSGIEGGNRFLTWMVYLNDVENGGETEFLQQSLRIKPKIGTVLIWPASFTHIHRGNPPLSGPKYIATGWVDWVPENDKNK